MVFFSKLSFFEVVYVYSNLCDFLEFRFNFSLLNASHTLLIRLVYYVWICP